MKYRLFLVATVWAFAMLAVLLISRSLVDLEVSAQSFRQRIADPLKPDPSIILVGIDDEVFAKEQYNRTNHAKVLRQLKEWGARLVFVDVIFDEDRGPEVDGPLLQAINLWPAVVLAGSSTTTDEGVVRPPVLAPALRPALEKGTGILAIVEKADEEDGSFRRYFLAADFGEGPVPSAALACYALLQTIRPEDIRYGDAMIDVPPAKIPVEKSSRLDSDHKEISVFMFPLKLHAPATGPGHQPGPDTYRVVPYLELLDPSPELAALFKNAIVSIGENTSSSNDLVNTMQGSMKGFEVHAQCLDRLIHHDFYLAASPEANFLAAAILVGLVAALGLITWPLPVLSLLGLMIPLAYSVFNIWLFESRHLELALAQPVLGALIALACHIAVRLVIASRFLGRFIPKEAAFGILMARKTAQATDATVIVTDIRGYTSLSETRTPVEMLKLLNEYHSVTVDIYHKHGGNVLTFQGDAQLVVFGYPRRLKDPVGASVTASVEVMEAIDKLRARWGITERKNFDVGAGICTGLVYIGDIGSRDQANYSVIGEVVRTSHKVQSMSDILQGNVLMDEPSYEACLRKPKVTVIPDVTLEGFPEPKTLYRVEREEPEPVPPVPF